MLRPLVEKFQGVFEAGDFLDQAVATLHETRLSKIRSFIVSSKRTNN